MSLAQELCFGSMHTALPRAAPAVLTLMMTPATASSDILLSPNAWMLKAPMRSVAVAGHTRATASRDSASTAVPILLGGMLSRREVAMGTRVCSGLGNMLHIWGQSEEIHLGPSYVPCHSPQRTDTAPLCSAGAEELDLAWGSPCSQPGLSAGSLVPEEGKARPAAVNQLGSASAHRLRALGSPSSQLCSPWGCPALTARSPGWFASSSLLTVPS